LALAEVCANDLYDVDIKSQENVKLELARTQ